LIRILSSLDHFYFERETSLPRPERECPMEKKAPIRKRDCLIAMETRVSPIKQGLFQCAQKPQSDSSPPSQSARLK
jgi:hypothetical protein